MEKRKNVKNVFWTSKVPKENKEQQKDKQIFMFISKQNSLYRGMIRMYVQKYVSAKCECTNKQVNLHKFMCMECVVVLCYDDYYYIFCEKPTYVKVIILFFSPTFMNEGEFSTNYTYFFANKFFHFMYLFRLHSDKIRLYIENRRQKLRI